MNSFSYFVIKIYAYYSRGWKNK